MYLAIVVLTYYLVLDIVIHYMPPLSFTVPSYYLQFPNMRYTVSTINALAQVLGSALRYSPTGYEPKCLRLCRASTWTRYCFVITQEFPRKMSSLALCSTKNFNSWLWHLVLYFTFVFAFVFGSAGCLSLPRSTKPPRTSIACLGASRPSPSSSSSWTTPSQANTALGRTYYYFDAPTTS